MKEGMKLWHVEASTKDQRNDRVNLNIWVFATTFDEAYEKVREAYPDAKLWKIIGDRWAQDVIVGE